MVGTQFLIVLGGGAFLLGLAFIVWIALTKRRGYGIPNWPKVVGRILDVDVVPVARETPQGRVTTFTPIIRYEYAVDGEIYEGRRQRFYQGETLTKRRSVDAAYVAARYTGNEPVDVFYNPVAPQQSALALPRPIAHNAVLFYGVTNAVMGALIVVLGIVLLPR